MTPAASADRVARSPDGTAIGYETIGSGDGVIVLGGALRTARAYLRFGHALTESFAVHLVDRRGRGRSGPQGARYSIDREVEDLLAVQAQTGAIAVFGHSYGGLIALETARQEAIFSDVIVYEPGVSIGGSFPSAWTPRYRELLTAGDTRGAFAAMVRGAGFAPVPLARMPHSWVRLMLRLAIREREWEQIEPLLATHLAEHEQLAAVDDGTANRFRTITARVLLLGGDRSPAFATTEPFEQLQRAIPDVTAELIHGLGHTAPDEKAPNIVAERVRCQLRGPKRVQMR
jgi:pimeloyl-ACP methyl ester carboxylesterase